MPEAVGREREALQLRVVVLQVRAQLGPALVVYAVQLQVQVLQRLVDLEGLSDVATALVVDRVVAQVQVREDLGGEKVLRELAGTRVANLVMT